MLKKKILSALLTIVMVICTSGLSGVYAASSSVKWDDISNGQLRTNVIADLNLITTIDETAVTWTSSKPHCVATDGTVTRWEEDEEVTLVAHRGGNTDTFNIIVSSYKSGDVKWDDSKLKGKTPLTQQRQWLSTPQTDWSLGNSVAPFEWKYDDANGLIYHEKVYGKWDAGYALTVNGNKYSWQATTPKTLLKNGVAYTPLSVEFTADITTYSFPKVETTTAKTYTFFYLDEELTDAEGKACRVGFFKNTAGNPSGGWTSLYMKDDNGDDILEVDTSYDYSVAVTGYMKPDLTPIVAQRRSRAHLNLVGTGATYNYPAYQTEIDATKRARYEQFSFRYRQKLDAGQVKPNSAQHFTFFYNNRMYALDASRSIGADDDPYRIYGDIPSVYYDLSDKTKTVLISKAGTSGTEFAKLASVGSALEVKTTEEGLSAIPTFVLPDDGTWSSWREVVMKTDKSECTTVMYIDGKPVYWKVTVSGQTYYSPFIVYVNATEQNDIRTGFSEPYTERLFVNFQVDSVKLERMTQAEYDDAKLGAVVNSFDGSQANFTFKRAGKYKVFFVDYEGGRLENVKCIEEKKIKGQVTNMLTSGSDKTWDKILVWGAGDSLRPLMDAVNVADLQQASN